MAFVGRVGHLEGIESPFSNAGGVVKTIEDVAKMALTGVGYIEAGSYTLEPRLGNAVDPEYPELGEQYKVYHHDPELGLTHNSLGMPNKGLDWLIGVLPDMLDVAHAHNKPLMVNIAPVSHEPSDELYNMAGILLENGVDGLIINGGCPNVKDTTGGNHAILSRNPEASREVAEVLSPWARTHGRKFWYRVSPQESPETLYAVASGVLDTSVYSAVLSPNTWPVKVPEDMDGNKILQIPLEQCGQSGDAMAGPAEYQSMQWRHALRGSGIDVIQSSGIMDARGLDRALRIGAVAGAGTTFFYESQNGWQQDVDRVLSELAT